MESGRFCPVPFTDGSPSSGVAQPFVIPNVIRE